MHFLVLSTDNTQQVTEQRSYYHRAYAVGEDFIWAASYYFPLATHSKASREWSILQFLPADSSSKGHTAVKFTLQYNKVIVY